MLSYQHNIASCVHWISDVRPVHITACGPHVQAPCSTASICPLSFVLFPCSSSAGSCVTLKEVQLWLSSTLPHPYISLVLNSLLVVLPTLPFLSSLYPLQLALLLLLSVPCGSPAPSENYGLKPSLAACTVHSASPALPWFALAAAPLSSAALSPPLGSPHGLSATSPCLLCRFHLQPWGPGGCRAHVFSLWSLPCWRTPWITLTCFSWCPPVALVSFLWRCSCHPFPLLGCIISWARAVFILSRFVLGKAQHCGYNSGSHGLLPAPSTQNQPAPSLPSPRAEAQHLANASYPRPAHSQLYTRSGVTGQQTLPHEPPSQQAKASHNLLASNSHLGALAVHTHAQSSKPSIR